MNTFADSESYARMRIGMILEGKWELVDILGAGGAAWVYLACDPRGAKAAVKILHQLLVGTSARDRFLREARIADSIGHAGVVRILTEGRVDKHTPFIVMEYLEGETLQARAVRKGGTLQVDEVMWAADEVLDILSAAHKKGIVHRDIKPENIFLTNDRRIKLLDFGVARLGERTSSSQGTQVGTLLGTLDFMPPEQARGEVDKVGVRADLWAVGATMFTLLSGRLVHQQADLREQILAVGSQPAPPLAKVAPHVPASIAMLVDYALRFDAGDRWTSAKSMRAALVAAYAASQAGDEAPPSSDDVELHATVLRPPDAPPMSLRRPKG